MKKKQPQKYIWIWPNLGSMNLSNKNIFWGTFEEYEVWVKDNYHKNDLKKMLKNSFRYTKAGKGSPNEN